MTETDNLNNLASLENSESRDVLTENTAMERESVKSLPKLFCLKCKRKTTFPGYTSTVLGVRSHCKLRDIPHLPDNKFEIEVVDRLPQVNLSTSLPKAASFSSVADSACVVTSATTCLYAGQR